MFPLRVLATKTVKMFPAEGRTSYIAVLGMLEA
jgi:hypothetical protein